MIPDSRATLSSWATGLLSVGRIVFGRDEAMREVGVGQGAFLDAAERLQRRGHLIRPRRGFYVIVPPRFLAWGAPPPSWYIDELMRFESRPYHAGLLKAAELHGATHQAVMEFQVVTDKRLPRIRAGRTSIAFHYRKNMARVAAGVEDRKVDTGYMKISSPELTALDLLRYPRAAGGLDNVATVLADLGGKLDAERLAALSKVFERPVAQRLGYLLARLGHAERIGPLHAALPRPETGWVELDPAEANDPDFTPAPVERDRRWRVIVRRVPEADS